MGYRKPRRINANLGRFRGYRTRCHLGRRDYYRRDYYFGRVASSLYLIICLGNIQVPATSVYTLYRILRIDTTVPSGTRAVGISHGPINGTSGHSLRSSPIATRYRRRCLRPACTAATAVAVARGLRHFRTGNNVSDVRKYCSRTTNNLSTNPDLIGLHPGAIYVGLYVGGRGFTYT